MVKRCLLKLAVAAGRRRSCDPNSFHSRTATVQPKPFYGSKPACGDVRESVSVRTPSPPNRVADIPIFTSIKGGGSASCLHSPPPQPLFAHASFHQVQYPDMLSIRTLSALLAFSAIGLAAPAPADTKATEEPIWEDDTLWNGFLARACVENHQSREDVFKVWEDQNCVLAALGTNTGSQPVDRFLLFNFEDTIDNIPLSAEIPAPSEEVLAEHFHLDTKTSISEENLGYAYFGSDCSNDYPWRELKSQSAVPFRRAMKNPHRGSSSTCLKTLPPGESHIAYPY